MSNPCFEFWLILHRADLDDFTDEEKDNILNNKKVSNTKHYVDIVLEKLIGHSYKKRPKGEDFIPYVYDAIRRAKNIHIDSDDLPKDLGSDVYLLLEKLIKQE